MRRYYEAYDDRYRQIHDKGLRWSYDVPTPIVLETMEKYGIGESDYILEIGCGEGRDAKAVLDRGLNLTATDISDEAISFCRKTMPDHADHFEVLDCISGVHAFKYDLIYSVAVIHMLVEDDDRKAFYKFVHDHLNDDGVALICSMGDGKTELSSDTSTAFTLQERNHRSGKVLVAGTSCRMVTENTFRRELEENGFSIVEKGITTSMPDFDKLMFAVVTKRQS